MRRGMTTGWGTKVDRVFSAASGAVLVVALAGCSLGGSTLGGIEAAPSSPSSAVTQSADDQPSPAPDEPPAFHFRSGDLILGDFTYDDVAGNIFNPCEEITAEEFAAIGFEMDGRTRSDETKGLRGCALKPVVSDFRSYVITGGSGNFQSTKADRKLVRQNASSILPNAYTYVHLDRDDDVCGAAVDTSRGQFGIGVGQIEGAQPREAFCERAIEVLEAFYQLEP